MPEIAKDPIAIKKIAKKTRAKPANFAFCLGSDIESSVFMADMKRKPAALAKLAKKESGGKKVMFGTFQVAGKDMTITPEKEFSGYGRKLLLYLKKNKLRFKPKAD